MREYLTALGSALSTVFSSELAIGFLLGILASTIAALVLERLTSAKLEVVRDPNPRALGELADGTKLEYHHVVVRNRRTPWPLSARRPAWSCQATLSLFKWTGEPLTATPIKARWSSQPEPISTFVIGTDIVQAADLAKIMAGRRLDIYSHQDERLVVALKHGGSPELHLFSNESYQFERGCNPAWRVESGTFRLRVVVHYEGGAISQDFALTNTGNSLDDVKLELWSDAA